MTEPNRTGFPDATAGRLQRLPPSAVGTVDSTVANGYRLPLATARVPRLGPRDDLSRAPLSFQQEWWWKYFEIFGPRLNARFCAVALRIRGRLDIEALRHSIQHVVQHHESLRTRIVVVEGRPAQEIDRAPNSALEVINVFVSGDAAPESEARRLIEELVNLPIDVSVGPLFGARLLRIADHDHVLAVAMNHVISDHMSEHILLRDVWTAYVQLVQQRPVSLAEMPIQFPDYAAWQRRTHEIWTATHGSYWATRLHNAPCQRFPIDGGEGAAARFRTEQLPVSFGNRLTEGLRNFSRHTRTTLVMTVLTAYAASLLRWQERRELIVGLLVTGRNRPQLENTIGFLASVLYLRIELKPGDTFLELLRRVTQEFCTAYLHCDSARLSVPVPGPDFKRCTTVNWLPRTDQGEGALSELQGSPYSIELEPFSYRNCAFDIEWDVESAGLLGDPGLLLSDTPGGISGYMHYRSDQFRRPTIERLCGNLRDFSKRLLDDPNAVIETVKYN